MDVRRGPVGGGQYLLPPRSLELHEVTDAEPVLVQLTPAFRNREEADSPIRPYQSLGYLTPAEYLASLGIDMYRTGRTRRQDLDSSACYCHNSGHATRKRVQPPGSLRSRRRHAADDPVLHRPGPPAVARQGGSRHHLHRRPPQPPPPDQAAPARAPPARRDPVPPRGARRRDGRGPGRGAGQRTAGRLRHRLHPVRPRGRRLVRSDGLEQPGRPRRRARRSPETPSTSEYPRTGWPSPARPTPSRQRQPLPPTDPSGTASSSPRTSSFTSADPSAAASTSGSSA